MGLLGFFSTISRILIRYMRCGVLTRCCCLKNWQNSRLVFSIGFCLVNRFVCMIFECFNIAIFGRNIKICLVMYFILIHRALATFCSCRTSLSRSLIFLSYGRFSWLALRIVIFSSLFECFNIAVFDCSIKICLLMHFVLFMCL